ncbi:MAG: SpoIIE family protein phosphatase [Candidatus Anammoximicrobium sp.]|nr:SpoIIE family protein phosphatase [Candidatus Anammoximicrobium sp.]
MRILVGWDDIAEAELIDTFLNVDENTAQVFTDAEGLTQAATNDVFDAVLMDLTFPSENVAFELFEVIRRRLPNAPVVGAWRPGEISQVAKFIKNGLHSFISRDDAGDFVFLLTSIMEAAFLTVQAQRAQIVAEKLREEVEAVRQLQEAVLPHDLPMPQGYKIVARYEPSQIRVFGEQPVVMAGGDYYDVFNLEGNQIVIVLGDAAGHGVKACMSIMTMHTLISMIRDRRFADTAEFVTEVNRRLCHSTVISADQGGFITLLYCTLDPVTHRFEWTSAGHPMPLLQDLATNEIHKLGSKEEGGLPLIIDEDWEYEKCQIEVPRNCRILLYTDGLDEAFPQDGKEEDQFGEVGIIKTLKDSINLPLAETLERLFHDSNEATQGTGRHDDTSVVLLERRD